VSLYVVTLLVAGRCIDVAQWAGTEALAQSSALESVTGTLERCGASVPVELGPTVTLAKL